MGFFDRFKRGKKDNPTKVVNEPLVNKSQQFVDCLQKASNENLSSEQLKSRFIQSLDIDNIFKNNPIVKKS